MPRSERHDRTANAGAAGAHSNAHTPGVANGRIDPDPSASALVSERAAGLTRELEAREAELAYRRRDAEEVEAALAAERAQVVRLEAALADAWQIASEMESSVTWAIYRRLRTRVFDALGGQRSIPVRVLHAVIRRIAQRATGPDGLFAAPAPPSPVVLPQFAQPRVSLVMPLYAHAGLTEAALISIARRTSGIAYEVILIDDDADPETKALLARVEGAKILVNPRNQGYLRSVNRGAGEASGEWIVLCNNDIEVREGWLQALLACGESADDVGIVTPRYLFPDLTINEAGGIIWRDATGMNYGRGQPAELFHWGHRREVDYGSAAALLVRAELWRALGGYDERFIPMYYEDADLCFAARELGWRVLYEPRAEVIHIEGATAGRDIADGPKRHQELNRQTFAGKWGERLAEQPRNTTADLRTAANRARGPRVLIVDYRLPAWDRDAGSLRLWHMIDELSAAGCRITMLPDDADLMEPYGPELQRKGVEIWHGDINIHGELETIGAELSMVILCRPHTAARWLDLVRALAPGAQVVYDTIDLHWLRELRRSGGRTREDLRPGTQPSALRELENAVMRSADRVLAVTEDERALIQADIPGADVRIVPTVHTISVDVNPFAARAGVLFVGGFAHPPNVDAAERLVKRVMPIVWRRLGPVPVVIVGGSPPVEVRRLGSSLVDITGWVPEIDPYLAAARAMVAPLSWGAGLKGKVTQSLAAGLPVVTTSIGAEGLEATDGRELLIADDDEELAERVILTLTDSDRWTALSEAGQAMAAARFSADVMAREMHKMIEETGRMIVPVPEADPTSG